jgi:hypothetical protein
MHRRPCRSICEASWMMIRDMSETVFGPLSSLARVCPAPMFEGARHALQRVAGICL